MKQSPIASDFVGRLSAELYDSGRYSISKNYLSALRSVLRFSGDESLSLKTLFTRKFLCGYETFLIHKSYARNTISFLMRTLRAIYNKAVKAELLARIDGLFDGLFTGSVVTAKRAADRVVIARIVAGDLSAKPHLEICRDMFLLSLELQGMTFIDLAHLRKSDIRGNLIIYCRRKTGGVVQVVMLPEVRALFDKYAGQVQDSPYLLPLITGTGRNGGQCQYQSALRRQNRQLKELAEHLGIDENLTTYVSRHTWATYAYHGGISVGVVSQGMGHHTEEVTRIYLSNYEHSELERANYIVLQAILSPIANGQADNASAQQRAEAVKRMLEVERFLNRNKDKGNKPERKPGSGGLLKRMSVSV